MSHASVLSSWSAPKQCVRCNAPATVRSCKNKHYCSTCYVITVAKSIQLRRESARLTWRPQNLVEEWLAAALRRHYATRCMVRRQQFGAAWATDIWASILHDA